MTFQISDNLLQQECVTLAIDIFAEFLAARPGENPEDWRDEAFDRAHEAADGHEWVIYNHKALMICAHCDTASGEDLLAEVGVQEPSDIYRLACIIAYGEMRARIEAELSDLIDNYEPEEDAPDVGNDD